jgi:hypothetical protein
MNSPEEIVGQRLSREAAIARTNEADARTSAAANLEATRREAFASIRASITSLAGYEYFEATIIRPTLQSHGRFRTKTETGARVAWKLTSEEQYHVDSHLEVPVWFGLDGIVYRMQTFGGGWTATPLEREGEKTWKEVRAYLAGLVLLLDTRTRNKQLDREIAAKYNLDHPDVVAKLDGLLELSTPYPTPKELPPGVDVASLDKLRVREKAAVAWLNRGTLPAEPD